MDLSKDDKLLIRVFNTADGKAVLAYLSRVFFNDSVYTQGDPYHTVYRSGQQDVIGFIKQTLEEEENARRNLDGQST